MTGRRRPGRDRGSFTAELAAGLPALMLLLFAGLTAVGAATTKAQCVDAAREGAVAAGRGEPGAAAAARVAPDGAAIDIGGDAETVTVSVRARIRVLGGGLQVFTVAATAVAGREPVVGWNEPAVPGSEQKAPGSEPVSAGGEPG